jgi:hypothetical protein
MTDRCEPPPGTVPGTVCVLSGLTLTRNATWMESHWLVEGWPMPLTTDGVASAGWRFVRVAETGDAR